MPRRSKPPFPINLIWNVKAFYVVFILVMIASLAAVGLAPGLGSSNPTRPAPVDEETPLPDETPVELVTFDRPEKTIDASQNYNAVIKTDQGDIVLALNPEAPEAANSFAFLAGQGFYDGLEFYWVYRDANGSTAYTQAGDPTCSASGEFSCTGSGGPGYTLTKEGAGGEIAPWTVVAPAVTAGEDLVHGSIFVISLGEEAGVEGTVLGHVVEGQDILDALEERVPCFGSEPSESNPCEPDDQLSAPLVIQEVIVQPA